MRGQIKALPLLLVLLLCLAPLSAFAEELWSEEYYRAMDYSGQLSDAEREHLDEYCLTFLEQARADLAVAAVTGAQYGGTTIEAWAGEVYEECGFGYGAEHTGFFMVWDVDTDEVRLLPFGGAEAVVSQRYLDFVAGAVAKYREDYGVYGPLYAATKMMRDYLDNNPGGPKADADSTGSDGSGVEAPFWAVDSVNPRVGTDGDRPAWYPTDPDHFQKYHDPAAPRIVDVADIISDEWEGQMEARLAEIRAEVGKDMVIFTDVSSYDLSREVYAADFYDFNGYGVGDEYEGVCLFVCMEPGNRGFWTCCTGPETRELYSEDVANQIDDILFPYMKDALYDEGLSDWMENFRRIYLSGSPYTPDWAMDFDSSAPRTQDPEAPRVVDDGKLLTEAEAQALERRAGELRARYQVDVVLCTARSAGLMTPEEYADRFYAANGYGLGEGCDGILLAVFHAPGTQDWETVLRCYGSEAEKLTEANQNRLRQRCHDLIDDEAYGMALTNYLEQTDHALRTGRAPRSVGSWIASAVGSLLAGAIVGGISLHRARENMDTPAQKERAESYLDYGSMRIRAVADELRKTTTSRQYSPVEKRSSGGSSGSGGGGRSTYSSSYKGSSGTTHSGSGRSF